MSPAAILKVIADLALRHPEIAAMLVDVAKAALTSKNPWRAVVRKMIRVAAEKASDELADELIRARKLVE